MPNIVHVLKVEGEPSHSAVYINGTLIGQTYWPDVKHEDFVIVDPTTVAERLGKALGLEFEVQFVKIPYAIVADVLGLEGDDDEWTFSDIEAEFSLLIPHAVLHAAAPSN